MPYSVGKKAVIPSKPIRGSWKSPAPGARAICLRFSGLRLCRFAMKRSTWNLPCPEVLKDPKQGARKQSPSFPNVVKG